MKPTAAFAVLVLALLGAAALFLPAAAQTIPPAGSITVMSRPAGASVRLSGEQDVVGRTPMVLQRGLAGRYRLRSWAPGYEMEKRWIVLRPGAADSVWITLDPKNSGMAAARSLVLPGWGQFYNERPGHGWTMILLNAASVTTLAVAQFQYMDKKDLAEELESVYRSGPTSARLIVWRAAVEEAEDAEDFRRNVLVATGVTWGLNVLDALVFGPPDTGGSLALGVEGRVEPRVGPVGYAGARVRF